MSFIADNLSGASQLATRLAQHAGPGFSKDPADYRPAWVKLNAPEFNPADPKYRPDLDPDGFLIGTKPVGAEGVQIVILGTLSGCQERDRLTVDGKETTRIHAYWKRPPEVTPIKGKGGGLKTDRGGWVSGKADEVFFLADRQLCSLMLFDMHQTVAELTRQALSLGVSAMYEIRWRLTKAFASDGEYLKSAPHFQLLGVRGEADGPTEIEIAQAKKLSVLIGQLSYQNPDIPLRLVVGDAPMGEPPPPPPPPSGPGDHDITPPWEREGG